MKLVISTKGADLNDALRKHIEQRFYFALSRFSPRITRATVVVEDTNGPQAGVDKHCQIVMKLQHNGELAVEAQDADMFAAVSITADRAGRAVQRELERRRTCGGRG